jgi:hypothetical protein
MALSDFFKMSAPPLKMGPVAQAAVIEFPAKRGSARPSHAGCPETLTRIVLEAWDVKRQIDILKDRLDGLNSRIEEVIESGQAVVLEHTCRATRVLRQVIQIEKPDRVLEVLGEQRFADLVDEKTTYTPTLKFKHLLEDDQELAEALEDALTVRESTNMQYRAVA